MLVGSTANTEKKSMPNTATRLINLIMLLQHRPNQKAAHLAAELGVSVRTLHRYFAMLEEMGIPVTSERGPYGGFSLVRGYKMPPLVFTPEEAVAVALGTGMVEELWGELYREAARGALNKMENLLPDEQRHEVSWARRTLLATGMHRSDLQSLAPRLDKLRRAAREHRRVRMDYQSSRPESAQRDLDPYALVHRWGWWYVIGYCHLRQDVRTFRVDRILDMILLESNFDLPTDFNLRTYLQNELRATAPSTARIRFLPNAAHLARYNQAGWESLSEQPDGSIEVSLSVPDINWAASTALAYGPLVEVLEPPELRNMVAEWAQAVAKKYQENENGKT